MSFPDDNCVPAEVAQLDAFLDVALFVAFYFLFPKLGVALWQHEVLASFVAVPETAVDKYGGLVFAQYNVGGTGQALDVYAVAMGVLVTSHNQFWFCVLALDARHALVPLFFCHPVCHGAKIMDSRKIKLLLFWKCLLLPI